MEIIFIGLFNYLLEMKKKQGGGMEKLILEEAEKLREESKDIINEIGK